MSMNIRIKRAYEKPADDDGYRILVDRLWPRGIKKEDLQIDEWCKDIAPSNELRKWFNHDPARFEEFKAKYFVELDKSNAAKDLLRQSADKQAVTLVYSARDTENNQAVALKQWLGNQA